ncbi:MAG: DUF6279 family lipoprotein [Desulforhopalus sp.]
MDNPNCIDRISFVRRLTVYCIVVVSLTAGCGPRFVYPNLNWLIPWYVEDYLPMTGEQEASLRGDIEKFLYWHCRNELVRYVKFFRQTALHFEETAVVDGAFFERKTGQLEQFYRDLVQRIGPELTELLRSTDDKQVETLFLNLEKENRDLVEKHVGRTPEKRNERRQDRMKKLLRKWIGDVNEQQAAVVAVWSKDLDGSFDIWIANRRHVQKLFHRLIVEKRFSNEFTGMLTHMLINTDEYYTADYRAMSLQRRQGSYALLAKIVSGLTEKQRMRLVANLSKMADDLDTLRCL